MIIARRFAAALCLLLPVTVMAHNLSQGQRPEPVGIADRGELIYQQDKFSYQNWNSAQLAGKVRVILHIAGRMSAKEQNAALIEAIKAANLTRDRYQTTTVVNTDDAIPGTSLFVRSSIESNKRQFPWSQFIVDSHGAVLQAWKLEHNGSAVVVLDKDGRVSFAKEGALSRDEVKQVIALLHQLLAQG